MATETRQAILDAALNLFLQQGYHATSMRQIARTAGVGLSSIYNHFPTKESIFVALLEKRHLYQPVLDALQQHDPPDDLPSLLRAVAEHTRRTVEERPDFLNLMLIELTEFGGRHTPLFYQELTHQIQPLVRRFLLTVDNLRPIPVAVMVRAYLGLLMAYVLTERAFGEVMSDAFGDRFLDDLIDIFLHGVLKDEDSRDSATVSEKGE